MGLFNRKESCSICGNEKGTKISDGFICKECISKCGIFVIPPGQNRALARISDFEKLIEKNRHYKKLQEEREPIFAPNRVIGDRIMVDEDHKLWSLAGGAFKKKPVGPIYSLLEIDDYEIDEDGETVTKGGLGRAVAGGLLLGGLGAVVGGVTGTRKSKATCTRLNLNITPSIAPYPVIIQFITTKTKVNSLLYKQSYAQIQAVLSYFDEFGGADENVTESSDTNRNLQSSNLDEIKKLKELLDMDALTQEEFDTKKKELLGL